MQNSLLKPRIIDVEALGAGHAKVVMEPFERGYGHTLGNALRRVLLSSMVGYAPTEVTIAGVVHEYSSLDGVQEDVVDLLLNLKGVVFKVHNRDSVTLTLKKEGEGAILASDIDLPHDVELINPDHVIAHLTAGGKLDMQIKVEKGRGYVPGNVRRLSEDTNKTIGRDSSFFWQWYTPFNVLSGINLMAMYAQRHFHEYGTRPEQLAQIAMTCAAGA